MSEAAKYANLKALTLRAQRYGLSAPRNPKQMAVLMAAEKLERKGYPLEEIKKLAPKVSATRGKDRGVKKL